MNIKIKCTDDILIGKDNTLVISKSDVGDHAIGRGTFDLINEKKCSRKQVVITINDDNTVFISSNGINPSYLKKSSQEFFTQMNKNQNYILEDSDNFSLLYELYTFSVTFEKQAVVSATDDRKRKQIDQHTQQPSAKQTNNNEHEDNKKKKVDDSQSVNNSKSKKRRCPHGVDCYRKNIDHINEFDHSRPPITDTTPTTNNNNNNSSQQQAPVISATPIIKNTLSTIPPPPQKVVTTISTTSSSSTPSASATAAINNEIEDNKNSNIGKIIGTKYKKKRLTDALKERSLAFPFISTSPNTGQFNVEKATEIAAKAISEYLQFHEKEDDIKLKMYVEDTIYSDQLIDNFTKLFNDKWDKRFEIIKIDSNSLNFKQQFNNLGGCKLYATETNWRLKKTPQNKTLYEELLGNTNEFEKETKSIFPNPAKIGKVYPIPLATSKSTTISNCTLFKKYGIETLILVLGVNMNPLKPDAFSSTSDLISPLLLETYHSLFNVLDNL